MDEQLNENPRPQNPRRRRRTQEEIIKENYLPVIIAGVSLLLIVIFIIGAIVRGISYSNAEKESAEAAYQSSMAESQAHAAEAEALISKVSVMMANYDYDGALEAMNGFSGDIAQYNQLTALYTQCKSASASAVVWDDPNDVVNLSFHQLIADPKRAFNDNGMGKTYNRDYVTVEEFQRILQQLFENGYVLISLDDIVEVTTDASGNTTYTAKELKLPQGKKPLMITQTNVNSYYKQVDGDGDFLPDAGGDGFASKLMVDENGKVVSELINADGTPTYGAYDLVPVLDAFVAQNPNFSYKGAKAILAVSGYDGIFGHRIDKDAKDRMTAEDFDTEVKNATALVNKLKENGYTLACYTYGNKAYGSESATQIQADLKSWAEEIEPVIGKLDVLAFAKKSPITNNGVLSGEKYDVLKAAGFKYYLGFSSAGSSWADVTEEYFYQGRVMVMGSTLAHNAEWFDGMFKTTSVLDPSRGTVPEPI